jgi:hypothetical protein
MDKPFGARCVTAVLSQPRNDFVVLLNESCRLGYMPLGFGYVFDEKIAVHVAKIADNLRLRLSPRDSLPEIQSGVLIKRLRVQRRSSASCANQTDPLRRGRWRTAAVRQGWV